MAVAIPPELREAVSHRKCGVFVGAGVSRGSGLPDWSGLLRDLVKKAKGIFSANRVLNRDLTNLLKDQSKQLMLASILKEELGVEFEKYIERRFADPELVPSALHRAIIELPAAFIITTNYDNLLERAFLAGC